MVPRSRCYAGASPASTTFSRTPPGRLGAGRAQGWPVADAEAPADTVVDGADDEDPDEDPEDDDADDEAPDDADDGPEPGPDDARPDVLTYWNTAYRTPSTRFLSTVRVPPCKS